MRQTIRRGTFETNSSSVHSLVLIPYDVADHWRELGNDWWLDLSATEKAAESTGLGYGEIVGVSAPASIDFLVDMTSPEMQASWIEPGLYQNDIDVNWKLPLDVIERPEKYAKSMWSPIVAIEETDEGYLIWFE